MPDHDGFEICARLREFSSIPILMLTAKSQSSDVTRGFSVGADDYVKKPFSNDELVSRIESLLRRNKSNGSNANITGYSDDNLEIELASQKVILHGEEIALTPTEFKLLSYLIRHPHKTLSTRTLLTEVWGDAYSHDKALLSLYIHQLRQKLMEGEAEHKYIQTQWGQGYWFNPLIDHNHLTPVFSMVEEKETPEILEQSPQPKWLRWSLIALIVLLGIFLLQKIFSDSGLYPPADLGTSVEGIITTEGFHEEETTGVRGQVCVSNTGEYPTEDLAISISIQIAREQVENYLVRNVDVSSKSVLDPNESYCYPYEAPFDPVSEKNIQYRSMANIAIANFKGLMPESEHCPGPNPCMFGPSVSADFTLPEP